MAAMWMLSRDLSLSIRNPGRGTAVGPTGSGLRLRERHTGPQSFLRRWMQNGARPSPPLAEPAAVCTEGWGRAAQTLRKDTGSSASRQLCTPRSGKSGRRHVRCQHLKGRLTVGRNSEGEQSSLRTSGVSSPVEDHGDISSTGGTAETPLQQ